MNKLKKIQYIRSQLNKKLTSIGSWIQIPHSSIAEILGMSGYDWVAVDLEHGSIDLAQLPDLFRAIELGDTLPLARIAVGNAKNCKQALDAGAGGIIIPMIETADHLINCIEWSTWPPNGKRGVGFSRANLFGKFFEEYKEEASAPIIIAQIEDVKAIDQLDLILQVKGLDAIMIGPYDLSASMGIPGQLEDPEFLKIIELIKKKSHKFGIPPGIHIVKPNIELLKSRIREGFQFIAYSIDSVFLVENAKIPNIKK
jgi:2-dehydro-3-deoxyglucarate aldolase